MEVDIKSQPCYTRYNRAATYSQTSLLRQHPHGRYLLDYSTVGCRRTGGTALQPGPFLFFPNLADFVLISSAHLVLISSAHACTCMYNHVHVHVLHQNSFLTHFSSLSTFLNFGEIPAWPFFGKPFFGTRQYCKESAGLTNYTIYRKLQSRRPLSPPPPPFWAKVLHRGDLYQCICPPRSFCCMYAHALYVDTYHAMHIPVYVHCLAACLHTQCDTWAANFLA